MNRLGVALLACACAAPVQQFRYKLVKPAAVPPAWEQVTLGHVLGEPFTHGPAPAQVLADALEARMTVGPGDVELNIEQVRTALTRVGGGDSYQLGLRALFVFQRGAEREVVPLEYAINFYGLTRAELDSVYGRLVAGLCDALMVHPGALAFLGEEPPPTQPDSAVLAGATGMGPVLSMSASHVDVEAYGRVHWGQLESGNAGRGSIIFGLQDVVGVYAEFQARRTNTESGLGLRGGAGLAAVDLGGGAFEQDGLLGGLRYGIGGDYGLFVTDTERRLVIQPGFDIVATTELQGMSLLGSDDDGGLVLATAFRAGILPHVNVPFGQHLGVSAGGFVGTAYALLRQDGANTNTGFDFAWYPEASVFFQTSATRIHLGVTFDPLLQQISKARGDDVPLVLRRPIFSIVAEGRRGRGMGPRHEAPDPHVHVLATAFNPFLLIQPRGFKRGRSAPTAVASDSATSREVVEPRPAKRTRWVVFDPWISADFEPETMPVIRSVLSDVLATTQSAEVVPAEEMQNALLVIGNPEVTGDYLADVAGALGAQHAVVAVLWIDEAGSHYRLQRFDASTGQVATTEGTSPRNALLAALRATFTQLLTAPADSP